MRSYSAHVTASSLVALSIILAALFVSSVMVALATSKDDIVHPIAALGNCKDEQGCRSYCEQRSDVKILRACLGFAKKHNLLAADVIARGEKFAEVAVSGGPGGCRDEESCVTYCDNRAHMGECLDFAIRYKLIPPDELSEAQKILGALKSGLKAPGNCAKKDECAAYCENAAHLDECLAFAEEADLFSPEEIAEAKKVAPFIKAGETPGKCTSKAACEAYCSNEDHFEECISFAEKAGFVDAKEAAFAKKFKGKSPGDCAKGLRNAALARKACTAFCNNPVNQPMCFKFAVDAGIMTTEEATQAGSLSDFQACVPQAPQEIQQCFITHLGEDLFAAMKQGVLPLEGDMEEMMTKIREARRCVNRYADQSLRTITDDPDALSCINSQLGADYLEKARRGEVKCGDAAPAQKKIASCIEEKLGAKIDHCFSLACSEATTCLQGFQKTGGEKRDAGAFEMNPDIKQKLERKINACATEQIRTCLAKDCSEMMACTKKLQSQADGGQNHGASNLDPALEQELTAKITSCIKQESGAGENLQQSSSPDHKTQGGPQYPQDTGGPSYEIPITPEICANFTDVPACSYTGSPDSQNYRLCKKCYPDR